MGAAPAESQITLRQRRLPSALTADVQDRDGGGALLQISRGLFPFIEKVWADGGYNHHRVTEAIRITVEIVSKIAGQSGFVVLPRRWVVERFFAWVNRNRRLAKDVEATLKSAAAFLYAAAAPPPCSCYAVWLGQREFRNRLLPDKVRRSFRWHCSSWVRDNRGFASGHTGSPSYPLCHPAHEIPDSPTMPGW